MTFFTFLFFGFLLCLRVVFVFCDCLLAILCCLLGFFVFLHTKSFPISFFAMRNFCKNIFISPHKTTQFLSLQTPFHLEKKILCLLLEDLRLTWCYCLDFVILPNP